jgi:hypothetical protein
VRYEEIRWPVLRVDHKMLLTALEVLVLVLVFLA